MEAVGQDSWSAGYIDAIFSIGSWFAILAPAEPTGGEALALAGFPGQRRGLAA